MCMRKTRNKKLETRLTKFSLFAFLVSGFLFYSSTALLQFLNGSGPIVFEQPGKRPVGEQFAVGLAARAIVGFILRIDDPLNGGAAYETWQAVPTVNGHSLPKSRDLFWKTFTRFPPVPVCPVEQCS